MDEKDILQGKLIASFTLVQKISSQSVEQFSNNWKFKILSQKREYQSSVICFWVTYSKIFGHIGFKIHSAVILGVFSLTYIIRKSTKEMLYVAAFQSFHQWSNPCGKEASAMKFLALEGVRGLISSWAVDPLKMV